MAPLEDSWIPRPHKRIHVVNHGGRSILTRLPRPFVLVKLVGVTKDVYCNGAARGTLYQGLGSPDRAAQLHLDDASS